jgi:hypothetical protein
MKLSRTTYIFTHPKALTPLSIKAFSRSGAEKKFKKFIISKMYGDWAITYNAASVDKILREAKCVEQ